MIHLSTPESFMQDADVIEATCPVCQIRGMKRFGWIEMHCPVCDNYTSPETPARTVRLRREHLRMTVDEMAERAGVSRDTVNQYESRGPSKRYWQTTKRIVQAA